SAAPLLTVKSLIVEPLVTDAVNEDDVGDDVVGDVVNALSAPPRPSLTSVRLAPIVIPAKVNGGATPPFTIDAMVLPPDVVVLSVAPAPITVSSTRSPALKPEMTPRSPKPAL